MRDEPYEEILKEEERIKTMVKELLEVLMKGERETYLENHPAKANGYYTRDLLTLVGPVEDRKVPRIREGDFHPHVLPTGSGSSWSFPGLALYADGVSTRRTSVFGRDSRGALLTAKHFSLK